MDFSINLDFFLNRISDDFEKQLMSNHHKLIIKHIEYAKNIIIIKKELLELYQTYNQNIIEKNTNNKLDKFYLKNKEYINNSEKLIKELEYDGMKQKEFFKNNIFYLSKF